MRLYDLSIVLHPHITDVELPSAIENIRKKLQAMGAREMQEEQIGKQRLGYPIQGNRSGHIIYFRFESEEQNVNTLTQKLNLQPEVIRSMLSIVRHGLAFKPIHKPFRRGGTHSATQAPAFAAARVSAPITTQKIEEATSIPATNSVSAPVQKIDLAEIDKRIDDLINKETF